MRRRIRWIKVIFAWMICLTIVCQNVPGISELNKNQSVITVSAATASFTPSTDVVMTNVRKYMLANDTNPDFNSIWNVIDLERSGLNVPSDYLNTFYTNVVKYLEDANWQITKNKYTEYSKLILVLTSMGKNAQNVEGHNLLWYLSDFSNVKKQGFNGPIWALIALKSHSDYTIPVNASATEQTTEEGLISYLLSKETSQGGWTLTGDTPDTDITGMTIQALASYYGKRSDVTAAIDRAVSWLSSAQLDSGGYGTMGTETSESVAQVIVALSAIGINCTTDSRFLKNGKSPMNGLYQYYMSEGGFMHVSADSGNNGGAEGGVIDGLATEQGMYATIAYARFLNKQNSLYDMNDVDLSPDGAADESQYYDSDTTESTETTSATTSSKKSETTTAQKKATGGSTSITTKVTGVSLNYSQISLLKGKTRKLTVTVVPTNATNKKISWSSSNKKIATVTSAGKVKGIKAGTATITAKAKDGSGCKAVCTVVVYASTQSGSATSTTSKSTTKTASGQTKSLTTASSSKTTQNAGNKNSGSGNSNTKNGSVSGDATEATTEGGWSFAGGDYVPETYETDTTASGDTSATNGTGDGSSGDNKSGSWADKTITIKIPIGAITYIILGMVLLGAIEAVIWFIRKRRIK